MLNITSIASFYGRKMEDHSTAISVALALVSSPLDYVNSILSGSPLKHIAKLAFSAHSTHWPESFCKSVLVLDQAH